MESEVRYGMNILFVVFGKKLLAFFILSGMSGKVLFFFHFLIFFSFFFAFFFTLCTSFIRMI